MLLLAFSVVFGCLVYGTKGMILIFLVLLKRLLCKNVYCKSNFPLCESYFLICLSVLKFLLIFGIQNAWTYLQNSTFNWKFFQIYGVVRICRDTEFSVWSEIEVFTHVNFMTLYIGSISNKAISKEKMFNKLCTYSVHVVKSLKVGILSEFSKN